MDLQKKSPLSNLPKVVLIDWKLNYEGVWLPRDFYSRIIFPNLLSKTSLDFILAMGVNDHDNIIDNIKNKENLRLQLNSLKNKLF